MSSIEIEIRRSKRLRFATHLEVIKNASAQAQEADSPLSIPFVELAHTFPTGKSVSLKNGYVKPDALFGIAYPPADDPDYRFFALEYDRGHVVSHNSVSHNPVAQLKASTQLKASHYPRAGA
jgi:hypothetical protein